MIVKASTVINRKCYLHYPRFKDWTYELNYCAPRYFHSNKNVVSNILYEMGDNIL